MQNKTKVMFAHKKLINFAAKGKSVPQNTNITQSHPACRKTCPSQTSLKELAKSDIILMRILFSQRKQKKLPAKFFHQMTVRLHIKLMFLMWRSIYYYICMLEDCLICIWTKITDLETLNELLPHE